MGLPSTYRHLLAGLATAAAVVLLNQVSARYPDDEQRVERAVFDHAFPRLDHATAIVVGGSIACAIDLRALNEQGESLYLLGIGNGLAADEAVLAAALPRGPDIRRVYLAVDPEAFALGDDFLTRVTLYRALEPFIGWRAVRDGWAQALIAWHVPLVRKDRWQRPVGIAEQLLRGRPVPQPTPLPLDQDGRYVGFRRVSGLGWEGTERIFAGQASAMTSDMNLKLYYDHGSPARNGAILHRIDEQLAARGIQLVLFSPPVSDVFRQTMRDAIAPLNEAYRSAIADEVRRGALFFDYSDDPVFRHNDRLFGDPIHLNAEGARIFSTELRADLDRIARHEPAGAGSVDGKAAAVPTGLPQHGSG